MEGNTDSRYVGIICIYKDKICSEKCVAYNSDGRYPTKCKILNCMMSLAKKNETKSKR